VKGAVSKGSASFISQAQKKKRTEAFSLNARRYLVFVQLKSKVVFKNYTPNQVMMLPPGLEERIEENIRFALSIR